MSTPPADALISSDQIEALATLYDTFARTLTPLAPEVDQAEKMFLQEVASLYDGVAQQCCVIGEK